MFEFVTVKTKCIGVVKGQGYGLRLDDAELCVGGGLRGSFGRNGG